MSTYFTDSVAQYLLGKTRSAVLSLLYLRPDERMFVREIITAVGMGSGAVQRELEHLEQLGLIERSRSGKQVYYQAVTDHPTYLDLSRFLVKTTGIAVVIRDALGDVDDQINVAFLYGSIARGDLRRDSDIDVLIVGSMSFMDISIALSQVDSQLHREVNPTVYSPTEFHEKVQAGNHFLKSILEEEIIMLIGGGDELGRLVEPSVAG